MTEAQPSRGGAPLARAEHARVCAGVCAGLAHTSRFGTRTLRTLFVLGALAGGIGVVVYLACWLVIPSVSDQDGGGEPHGIVVLAWAVAGFVGVLLVAALSTAATVFGFGWVIVVAAAIVAVVVTVTATRRVQIAAGLVAVAALTLPAAAVALSSLRLAPQTGNTVSAPATAADVEGTTFRSGLGTQLIDLRRTTLPLSGTVLLRIDAGIRRTIVALPSTRCVHVTIRYAVHPFASQLAAMLSGHSLSPSHEVILFGEVVDLRPGGGASAGSGGAGSGTAGAGPTLEITFTSQGGSLVVRDYPDSVSPDESPNWPGFRVTPERRPDLQGEPKAVAKAMMRDWRLRRAVQIANERYVADRIAGPCSR